MPRKQTARQRKEGALLFRSQEIKVIRRAFQRNLRVQVKPGGEVLLTSGFGVPDAVLERFLAETWGWVEKVRDKQNKLMERFPPKKFAEGEEFYFLGFPRILKFVLGTGSRLEVTLRDRELVALVPPKLWPGFDPRSEHLEWREPIRRFYEYQGRLIMASRMDVWAGLMKLRPSGLRFRCQSTRWGSCNSQGKISLNWRLIAAPVAVIDYVIIHELAHLKVMNHSPKFWTLVEQFCPEHKPHSTWLRKNHLHLDFLKN